VKAIKGRLERLEEITGRGQEPTSLVGIVGDPESEARYELYLRSGIRMPFIWFDAEPKNPRTTEDRPDGIGNEKD